MKLIQTIKKPLVYVLLFAMIVCGGFSTETSLAAKAAKAGTSDVSGNIDFNAVPRDFKGEYDGSHGTTVVKRDYEIHLENITEDGDISGKAIIAPSDKAKEAYGANGSYHFEGHIDLKTGDIHLQGTEWIEFPVSYTRFNMIYFEGTINLSEGTIKGKTEFGIWEMQAIDFGSLKSESGFKLQRDNNSFIHTNKIKNQGFYDVNNYYIDDSYFKRLTQNSDYGEINRLEKTMWGKWHGSCYGIAVTMGLLYENYISVKDLTNLSKANYYSIGNPCSDTKFLNNINYYQLSQSLEVGGKESAAVSMSYNNNYVSGLTNWKSGYDSLPVFLKRLVEYSQSDHVELLGFSTAKSGHAVLVTGCRFDTAGNKYKVEIYDENSIGPDDKKGSFCTMEIEKDFSGFTLRDANGTLINNNTYKCIYFLDWKAMKSIITHDTGQSESRAQIEFPAGESFKIVNSSGETLTCDGNRLSGDLPIYDIKTVDTDQESRLVVETANTSDLKISDVSQNIDVNATVDDSFISLKGKSIESAELDFDKGISINGRNFEFETYVTTEKVTGNEKGMISLSGASSSDVDIKAEDDSLSVTTQTGISDVQTASYLGVTKTERQYEDLNKDFTVDNQARIKGGTEKGNTDQTKKKTDISKAKITLSRTTYECDGKSKKPTVKVVYKGKKLTKGTHYTLKYKNNTKVGTASVVITGKGKYKGKVKKKFQILPAGTSIVGISPKSGALAVRWKKQTYSTTGYQIEYATGADFSGAVSNSVLSTQIPTIVLPDLTPGKRYYVRVRTYYTTGGKTFYSKWSPVKNALVN